MRLLKTIISLVFVMGISSLNAQSEKSMIRSGNNKFDDGNYAEAEVQYRKSLTENPNYYKGKFNLGDAMYEQENFEESGKIFSELAEANLTPEQKAKVYYNQGNVLMKGQKYGEAVEAYKKSLRADPSDFEAKYNLEYARKKLSDQQQQQQDQDQNQDQDKDQQDQQQDQQDKQDENKDEQDKEQKQDQEKQDQNQDQEEDKSDQEQDQQQQQQPQQISKQDAKKMLDALKNDEKETLQKLQKEKAKAARGSKTEIDW